MPIRDTLYNTSKTRTLLIIAGSMLCVGLVVAIYSFSKKPTEVAGNMAKIPSNIIITPGSKSSDKYIELQNNANILGTKKAETQGKSFIPTIIEHKFDNTQAFNAELSKILKDKNESNPDYERLSKQLALLLSQFNQQGQEINNLLRLIRELQNQKYDVSDLENLLRKLMKDGYNTADLAKLLEQLRQKGYDIKNLEDLLRKLLAQGYDPDLINKILQQLLKDRLDVLAKALKDLQDKGIDSSALNNLLDNLLKQLMQRGYDVFNMNIMLDQLKKDGYDVAALQDLLNKLKMQGEDIKDLRALLDALRKQNAGTKDLDDLLARLAKQGADLDALRKLLAQLQQAGFSKDDLAKMLQDWLNKNLSPDDIYNALLKKLQASAIPKSNAVPKIEDNKSLLSSILNNQAKSPDGSSANAISESAQKYEALIKKQQEKLLEEERNKKLAEQARAQRQANSINAEMKKKDLEAMLANMNAQADQLSANLTKIPPQIFVKGDELPKNESDVAEFTNKVGAASSREQADVGDDLVIQAGTILFAVIQTAVNSDEPGPILAKIVQGPLKDTTLIGSMQMSNNTSEGLLLSFTTANIPTKNKSSTISAVAIDPETARNVIASEVDHHYLLRWGSIFASSFLKGYAQSIAQRGNTVTQAVNGTTGAVVNTTQQNPQSSSKQQVYQGLAEVGAQWSQNVSNFASRPNTIKINSGTSIGLLLTADFVISAGDKVPSKQDKAASFSVIESPKQGATILPNNVTESAAKTSTTPQSGDLSRKAEK